MTKILTDEEEILSTRSNLPDYFDKNFGKRFFFCHPALEFLSKTNNKCILLARNIKNNCNKSSFEYFIFYTVQNFWEFFQTLTPSNNQFYCVYYTQKRSLYLDIDCYNLQLKINFKILNNQITYLFKRIKQLEYSWSKQIIFEDNWSDNFYIYSCNRKNKLSIHILNPNIITLDLNVYKQLCYWLTFNSINHIFHYVDIMNNKIQLYRLPFSLKRKKNTLFNGFFFFYIFFTLLYNNFSRNN